jgi:hypothetical protein
LTAAIVPASALDALNGRAKPLPQLGERSRLYVLAGGAKFFDFGDKSTFPLIGAGIDVGISSKLYAKLDYRVYLGSNEPSPDGASGTSHQLGLGLGIRF